MCFKKKNKAEKQKKEEKRTKNTEKETPKAVKKELTKNEVKQEESKKTETKKVVAKKAETKKVETKKGETKKADTKNADSAEVKAPKERKALYRVVYSKELDKIRKENSFSYKIEVDGGINQDTALKAVEAGVDMLVSGSYVYNSKDRAKVIKELKSL